MKGSLIANRTDAANALSRISPEAMMNLAHLKKVGKVIREAGRLAVCYEAGYLDAERGIFRKPKGYKGLQRDAYIAGSQAAQQKADAGSELMLDDVPFGTGERVHIAAEHLSIWNERQRTANCHEVERPSQGQGRIESVYFDGDVHVQFDDPDRNACVPLDFLQRGDYPDCLVAKGDSFTPHVA